MDRLNFEDMEKDLDAIDKVHSLVKQLASENSEELLAKADHYLASLSEPKKSKTFDRTVINKSNPVKKDSQSMDPDAFMAVVEKDAAERAIRRKKNKELAEAKKDKGNTYLKAGDFPRAIICYTKAIDLLRDNMIYYVNRAIAYYRNHDFEASLKDCDFVIYVDEKNPKAYFHRGKALLALDKPEESLQAFAEAEALNPKAAGEIKEFLNQANFLIQNKQILKEHGDNGININKTNESNDHAALWSPDEPLKLLLQLSCYQGIKVPPPSGDKFSQSQTNGLDDGNVAYFTVGVRLLAEIMTKGSAKDVESKQKLFKDKGGYSLLKSTKHLVVSKVMVEDLSLLTNTELESLASLWDLTFESTNNNAANAFFLSKDTQLVNLSIKHLQYSLDHVLVSTSSSSSETQNFILLVVIACCRVLCAIFNYESALLAWLDNDSLPGQPRACALIPTLFHIFNLDQRMGLHFESLNTTFYKNSKQSIFKILYPYAEKILTSLIDNVRFKTAICHHPPSPEWVRSWHFFLSKRPKILPPSTMTVLLHAYSNLLQFNIVLSPNPQAISPSSVRLSYSFKITHDIAANLGILWCERYLPLHKDPHYVPLLLALAMTIIHAWKRTMNHPDRNARISMAKDMVKSTSNALSEIAPNQVCLRPTFLAVLDQFLPGLEVSDIAQWCMADESDQSINLLRMTSNLNDISDTSHFHCQLCTPLHIIISIISKLNPMQRDAETDTSATDVNCLISCAVKILAVCCQNQQVVQFRVGDDEILVQKLAGFIDPKSNATGPLIANAALCLRCCIGKSKVGNHLLKTDIMRHLLIRCDATTFTNANDTKSQSTIKANCASLAGTLARSDTRHYKVFSSLHGLEIVMPFQSWNEKASC